MANRTKYPAFSYGSSREYCEIRILLAGAATTVPVANVDGADIVASIAHAAGSNKWTVTLKDQFNKVIAHSADLVELTGTGDYATVGLVTGEASASPVGFSIWTWNAAATAMNDSTRTVVLNLAFRNGNWGVK